MQEIQSEQEIQPLQEIQSEQEIRSNNIQKLQSESYINSFHASNKITPYKMKFKYSIEENFLIINSSDRKWYGDLELEDGQYVINKSNNYNRYHFQVYLKDMINQISIDKIFKNIHSIKITSIIMARGDNADINSKPKADVVAPEKYLSKDIFQYPYLLLNIEEFSQNLYTTNKLTATSALATPVELPVSRHARSYVGLGAYFGAVKTFYPNVIGSLNTLNLHLMYSNGETYASNNPINIDNHNITKIEYTSSTATQSATMILTIDPPFLEELYRKDDIILIRNCRIQNSTADNSHVQSIESFLNRKIGHTILNDATLEVTSSATEHVNFSDTLVIASDIRVNQDGLGLYDYFENIGNDVINDTNSTFIGEMLNYSLQPTFNISINTMNRDNNGAIEIDYEL